MLGKRLLLSATLALAFTAPALGLADEAPSPQQVEALVGQARKGDKQAQFKLAKAYEKGNGTRQSYSEAVRWYLAAANQGEARAQFQLGLIYEEGRPEVKRNVAYSLSWYEEAARNGLKDAIKRLRSLTASE